MTSSSPSPSLPLVPSIPSSLLTTLTQCISLPPTSLSSNDISLLSSISTKIISLFDLQKEFHVSSADALPLEDIMENISAKILINMDTMKKERKKNKKNGNNAATTPSSSASLSSSPISSSLSPSSSSPLPLPLSLPLPLTIFNPNDKPQRHFSPLPDNSHHPWLPILLSKPNGDPSSPLINYISHYKENLSASMSQSPQLPSGMRQHVMSIEMSENNGRKEKGNGKRSYHNNDNIHTENHDNSTLLTPSADYIPPHPYDKEITNLHYPIHTLTPSPHSDTPPAPLLSTPLHWISTLPTLLKLLSSLSSPSVTEIAIDLEHHNYRSYLGFTCLMQISTRTDDYLVDTIALRGELHRLLDIFTNPHIMKVFHGADMDMQWLQRDFGLYVVNLFDTGQASRVLEMSSFSFAHVLTHYCGVETNKQYQLADWRQRPLTEEMVQYGRMDTHYLLYIKDRMMIELIQKSKDNTLPLSIISTNGTLSTSPYPSLLVDTLQRSRHVSLRIYKKDSLSANLPYDMVRKAKLSLSDTQMRTLREMLVMRDKKAREMDESPHYLCNNNVILAIVTRIPTPKTIFELNESCRPSYPPPLVRKFGEEILNIIRENAVSFTTTSPFLLASKSPMAKGHSGEKREWGNDEESNPIQNENNTSGTNLNHSPGVSIPSNQKMVNKTRPSSVSLLSSHKDANISRRVIIVDSDDDNDDDDDDGDDQDVNMVSEEKENVERSVYDSLDGREGKFVELDFTNSMLSSLYNQTHSFSSLHKSSKSNKNTPLSSPSSSPLLPVSLSSSISSLSSKSKSSPFLPLPSHSSPPTVSVDQYYRIIGFPDNVIKALYSSSSTHPHLPRSPSLPPSVSSQKKSAEHQLRELKSKNPHQVMIMNKHTHYTLDAEKVAKTGKIVDDTHNLQINNYGNSNVMDTDMSSGIIPNVVKREGEEKDIEDDDDIHRRHKSEKKLKKEKKREKEREREKEKGKEKSSSSTVPTPKYDFASAIMSSSSSSSSHSSSSSSPPASRPIFDPHETLYSSSSSSRSVHREKRPVSSLEARADKPNLSIKPKMFRDTIKKQKK